MKIKLIIFVFILGLVLGFFFYSCGKEKPPTAPAQVETQNTRTSENISRSETSQKPANDPEKARKIEELISKLEDSDERAAYDAALQLALLGDETAVEPLIGVAESESGMMRVAAINALGSIGDERALDVLIEALGDSDVNVRRNAASGLGNLRDESAIEPLIEALRDQDDWVQMDALGSLKKITKQNLPDYDAWSEWYMER